MCRSNEQGGRRCPHDDSNARRIRRVNASLKAQFSGEVHEPIHSSKVNQENLVPQSVQPTISLQTVKADIRSFQEYRTRFEKINDVDKDDMVVDGVLYEKYGDYRRALLARIEEQTIKVGSGISLLAAQRTGFTDEMIIDGNAKALVEAESDYEDSKKEYAEFVEYLKETYNVSEMDAASHVKVRMMDIKDKIAQAAENGEEYTPPFDVDKMENDAEIGMAMYRKREDDMSKLRSIKNRGTEEAIMMVKANREAQKQILEEIRSLGGTPVVSEKSNASKVKVLKEALAFMPTDWIDTSNETGTDLVIKATKRRAHYSDGSYQKEYKVVKAGRLRVLKDGAEPDNTYHQSGWIKVTADEEGRVEYVDEGGVTHERWIEPNETAYYAPDWEYARAYYDWQEVDPTKKPYGRGWELATVMDSKWNPETKENEYFEAQRWRRRVTKRNLVSISRSAELLIDGSPGYGDHGFGTALHEFMHRVEAKNPHLGVVEAKFIERRTTKEDGTREEMVRIYKGKNEFSQPDNFVDNYMGKHYDHSGGKHWEVLSTGTEAVWGGAFGSLMGLGTYKPDTEHRDFVLGVFATA